MWETGTIRKDNRTYKYSVKHYEEPSASGIHGGKISKLDISVDGKNEMHYDRGWDKRSADYTVNAVYIFLLTLYN